MDDSLEANFAQRSQHGRNMSVRFASGDLELLSLTQIHVALQQLAKSFNSSGLPLRDVGDGAFSCFEDFAIRVNSGIILMDGSDISLVLEGARFPS